ncbi:MAG TPA: SRPBCC family protein [Lentimicrobium sp.]|nr:SRPBCC family protein [Lentimicrobium sp.]
METLKKSITVESVINASPEKVWNLWNDPKHIVKWNSASQDWHTPRAENDLRKGGKFVARMEAKDGSSGFDFSGIYNNVEYLKNIAYTMEDGRKVNVDFISDGNYTTVKETFDPEEENPHDLQRSGWQAIMDNFKKYVESNNDPDKLRFEITINADVQRVYSTMIDKVMYNEWTAEFNPGSCFVGSWEKGSKIYFLGVDQDGNQGGMVSMIRENIPNRYISIEHIGIYKNGEEITSGEEAEGWAGSLEDYSYLGVDGSTLLTVELEGLMEYRKYFEEAWPRALKTLKEICEK